MHQIWLQETQRWPTPASAQPCSDPSSSPRTGPTYKCMALYWEPNPVSRLDELPPHPSSRRRALALGALGFAATCCSTTPLPPELPGSKAGGGTTYLPSSCPCPPRPSWGCWRLSSLLGREEEQESALEPGSGEGGPVPSPHHLHPSCPPELPRAPFLAPGSSSNTSRPGAFTELGSPRTRRTFAVRRSQEQGEPHPSTLPSDAALVLRTGREWDPAVPHASWVQGPQGADGLGYEDPRDRTRKDLPLAAATGVCKIQWRG